MWHKIIKNTTTINRNWCTVSVTPRHAYVNGCLWQLGVFFDIARQGSACYEAIVIAVNVLEQLPDFGGVCHSRGNKWWLNCWFLPASVHAVPVYI